MARLLAWTAVVFLATSRAYALEPVPATPFVIPPFTISGTDAENFDIDDARADMRQDTLTHQDAPQHSLFVVKHHVGVAMGYDERVLHVSLGYYVTVAEW